MADYSEYSGLFGRLQIYTSTESLTTENVVDEVNKALAIHMTNVNAMDYLYWYRRGVMPVLAREKDVRPEINNKIVENHAAEIVDFKNGYFLTQPAFYTARKEDEETNKKVQELNEFLYRSGKLQADNELVDWFHTVGKADLFIQSTEGDDTPFEAYALDPRSAFVVKSLKPGNKPVFGGHVVINGEEMTIDVSDRFNTYVLKGSYTGKLTTPYPQYIGTAMNVVSVTPNPLGEVPIIEYYYNSVCMGAFEAVIPLIDALNECMSGRLDAIDQFVQSLLVFYNCELGQDDDGNDITPSYVRQAGALFLKSIGENRADLKEISSELNQEQTQVLVDYMYQQILTICGMPSSVKGTGSTSDTGLAVEMRDGWSTAETMARNTEDLFKRSNKQFDKIMTKLLREKGLLDISINDFDLNFTRNEMRGVQSKAQTLIALLQAGMAPTLALAKSGISADPVADYEASKPWMVMRWGDPNAPIEQPKTEIVEEDNNNGESDVAPV